MPPGGIDPSGLITPAPHRRRPVLGHPNDQASRIDLVATRTVSSTPASRTTDEWGADHRCAPDELDPPDPAGTARHQGLGTRLPHLGLAAGAGGSRTQAMVASTPAPVEHLSPARPRRCVPCGRQAASQRPGDRGARGSAPRPCVAAELVVRRRRWTRAHGRHCFAAPGTLRHLPPQETARVGTPSTKMRPRQQPCR